MPQVFNILHPLSSVVPKSTLQERWTGQEKQEKPTKQANKIEQVIWKVNHGENKGNL